ncbi:MAG: ribosomal protein S18-alanine N-acetyltransferase [bacterium]
MELKEILVRHMQEEDLQAVQDIEEASFTCSWPANSFLNEIRDNQVACYLVAQCEGIILGYCGAWIIIDEGHITTMAVHPDYRGKKIGKLLMWHMMDECLKRGVRWSTLEVRKNGDVAQKLYLSFGFSVVGERKEYYQNGDDALIMSVGNIRDTSFKKRMQRLWDEMFREE